MAKIYILFCPFVLGNTLLYTTNYEALARTWHWITGDNYSVEYTSCKKFQECGELGGSIRWQLLEYTCKTFQECSELAGKYPVTTRIYVQEVSRV